jgi:hypothetical protein
MMTAPVASALAPHRIVAHVEPALADTSQSQALFPNVKPWEFVCAGATFGALTFFATYFLWYFWTGALLI